MLRHPFRGRTVCALVALALFALPRAQAGLLVDFDTPVVTGPTQAPGVWYTDRYPPNGFTSPMTAPDGRPGTLLHAISSADQASSRPPAFSSAFYNTQGRKYDLPGGTSSLFIDLYVPSSWNSLNQNVVGAEGRLASLWATGFDAGNGVAAFPIIEFNNNTNGSGADGFRIWDGAAWVNVGGFSGFDQWYQVGFDLTGAGFTYYVNGLPVFTDPTTAGTASFGNVILQGYNAGNSYNINWDNLTTTAVPEPGSLVLFGLAACGVGLWARRRRAA